MTDYTKPPIPSSPLPCPFCGASAGPVNEVKGGNPPHAYGVSCDICSAEVSGFKTYDEAIAAWNTRAHPTEDREGLINVTDAEATIIAAAIGMLKNYGSTRDRILRLLTQGNIGRVYDKIDKKVII